MATSRHITLTPIDSWGPLPPHAGPPSSRRGWRLVERLLLTVAVVCLAYYGYVSAESALYQAYETRELDAILASGPAVAVPQQDAQPSASGTTEELATRTAPGRVVPAALGTPKAGSALGRLEIPRLEVSAIVRSGTDSRTLRLAIGHINGTAAPGESGNVGLAAHRDTFFRRLGEIQPDDEVRLVTARGTYAYRVEGTQIVNPRETWVLNQTDTPTLTLITCYPFRYVGSAPQRFVVRARLRDP
jgi:sortase A